jgi:hypothetical protein
MVGALGTPRPSKLGEAEPGALGGKDGGHPGDEPDALPRAPCSGAEKPVLRVDRQVRHPQGLKPAPSLVGPASLRRRHAQRVAQEAPRPAQPNTARVERLLPARMGSEASLRRARPIRVVDSLPLDSCQAREGPHRRRLCARYGWRKPGGRTWRWRDGDTIVFERVRQRVERCRYGWMKTPGFASTSSESPVHSERCTPGSARGARKPSGASR